MDLQYALLTAREEAGIGVIQIAGREATEFVQSHFEPDSAPSYSPDPDQLVIGTLTDGRDPIDEVVVRWIPPGEIHRDSGIHEINIHSSPSVIREIEQVLEQKGARSFSPESWLRQTGTAGEHADPIRRCALARVSEVPTRKGALALLHQARGGLSNEISQVRRLLQNPDDCETNHPEKSARKRIDGLLAVAGAGLSLLNPPLIALGGPPNVGKSTLLNALAHEKTALVHEQPGTTRDNVTAEIQFRGYRFRVFDTAGLRETENEIESEGIERSRARFREADVLIFLSDATRSEESVPEDLPADRILLVANKSDLLENPAYGETDETGRLRISALEKKGLDALREEMLRILAFPSPFPKDRPLPFLEEHRDILKNARKHLEKGAKREAARTLGKLLENRDKG